MTYTFDEIMNSINKCLLRPNTPKHNIFDIGTRGFYENPFTEVVAYIISSQSNYRYRSDFIKLFLESINILQQEVIESFLLDLKVSTQHSTLKGNYIDLLIYNSKYILIFENKVGHWLANPIDDYESDIKSRYAHLEPYFFVLSYDSVDTRKPWTNITIGDCFAYIKSGLSVEFKDKWDFFVEDFLNHYIPIKSKQLTKDEFEFYANNFSKIAAANQKVDQFIFEVVDRIKALLPKDSIKKATPHTAWGDDLTKAVRLYPFDSVDNVVLIFRKEGKFSISIYYHENPHKHLSKLHELVGQERYKNWKEGSFSCFARLDGKHIDSVEELVDECVSQLTTMMKYYG